MNVAERAVHGLDRFQQRHTPAAFVFGVVKKFGDDRAGSLAALVAYYGFLSLFPLLLVLVTVLGLVLAHNPSAQSSIKHSALAQFPIIGDQIANKISPLKESNPLGLIVGLAGLVWGSLGVSQAAQHAMAEVWNVPGVDRPGFWGRLARGLGLLGVLGLFVVISSGLAGVTTFGQHGIPARVGVGLGSVVVDVGLYLVAFRVLTAKTVAIGDLVPGSIVGGAAWAILQTVGGLLVNHQLRHASQVYGFFGIVLGLISWLYLGAQMTLYAAEINVVRARRLWPRSLVQPPLTGADHEVLTALALQEERRPEETVAVSFVPDPSETEKE